MAVSAAMIAAKFTPEDLHMYRVTFEQFDEDGSGKIDVGELQRALRGCGIECTGDEVIAMMSSVDSSGDLEIDFEEFLQLIYNFRTEQEYASTSDSSGDEGEAEGGERTSNSFGNRSKAGFLSPVAGAGFVSDEAALYGLTSLGAGLSFGDGGKRRRISGQHHTASRRVSLSLSGATRHNSVGAGDEAGDGLLDNVAAGRSTNALSQLSRLRTAAITQCPEHNLKPLVALVRQIREGLVRDVSAMVGDSADEERRITINVLQKLAAAKCPFVPSGSFVAAARVRREQQLTSLLSSSASINIPPVGTDLDPSNANATGRGGVQKAGPAQGLAPPTIGQIISFIDEVLDAANERMLSLVNMTYAYNSDGLYEDRSADDENLSKQQMELLKLVEAAAAVSGSGAQAAKRLSASSSSPHRGSVGGGASAGQARDAYDSDVDERNQKEVPTPSPTVGRKKRANKDSNTNNDGGRKNTELPSDPSKGDVKVTKENARPRRSKTEAKVEAALDNLSSFTFELERSADQKVGSDAFRAAAKKFPYFMFPIGSVCSVIDSLEKVHDTYEKALEGKEFLVKPRCKDGARCRLLGILEHQLALSHPCYSETIPCPHRHRPLHMACYHHDEDENPSAQATLREMQKQLHILDLSGLEIGDTGAKCLAHVLNRDLALRGKANHRIRHLKLAGNQISPEGAAVLFEQCGHLLSLDISNNGLGYKGSVLSGSAIGPSLQRLLSTSDSLLTLNLSRNRLSDRDARYITEALKDNTVLTHLDVQKNEFGSLFGGHMASALQENRELKVLLVGWNRLESTGAATLLAEVCKSSTIEVLDLSWTGVSDEGAQLLADFVAGSQLLRHLGLAHNSITGEGLINAKGPESQKTLSKAVQSSKTLTHLDLSFNSLGTRATRDFLRDLRENFALESLDIRCVKASDDISEEVKNYVKVRSGPPSLKPVAVQFGSSVTAATGPTNPIRAEKMGMEKSKATSSSTRTK